MSKFDVFANEWKDLYEEGKSLIEIGDQYKVNKSAVYRTLKKYGVTLRTIAIARREYHVIDEYFSTIDSHDKAYHLGLLYLYGKLNRKFNGILITIPMHDEPREEVFSLIDTITKRTLRVRETNLAKYVELSSEQIKFDLTEIGLANRMTRSFPNIDAAFIWSFFRGYFVNKSFQKTIYFSDSLPFLYSLQLLLNGYGINSSINEERRTFRIYSLHQIKQLEQLMLKS